MDEVAGNFYKPIKDPEGWKCLLAQPDKQWKTGFSAKTLAYCWQETRDFPPEVRKIFRDSGISAFKDIEFLVAFPEYKIALPGGVRASQNDIFVLAKGNKQLIALMVEGKVSEPFGEIISEWKDRSEGGKGVRLQFLCDLLGLDATKIGYIRYQLLHRTASALIEAKKFNALNAVMLVHSFSTSNEWFEDYQSFLDLFGINGRINSLIFAKKIGEVKLYFGWVEGNRDYLNK